MAICGLPPSARRWRRSIAAGRCRHCASSRPRAPSPTHRSTGHFANAEALALTVAAACFREHTRHITAALTALADPFERLRAGCEAAMRWGLENPGRYGLMMSRTLAGKQHHVEFFEAARESFGGLVEAVRHCGVQEPVPVAHTLMSAMHGLVDLIRKGRTIPAKAASVDEQIDAMLAMLLAYVRTQAPHAATDGGHSSAPADHT